MPALIACTKLWKTYRLGDITVEALRGVDLTIQPGECVAIMGSSGSGKSTLMNILGCLDIPTSGEYLLKGQDIARAEPEELAEVRSRTIGFVFQNFSLIPKTSALENVQLPLFYQGVSLREQRLRAQLALSRVGLANREHHYPSQLSGGQQQRVAIARALVSSPSLILADEPTGNLDTQSSQEIMDIFQDLNQKDGLTILVVTHEHDIAAYADRQIVMKDGQIVSDQPTSVSERVLS
ncbi:MAG: ABC transporter ATP-binding protein [Nitrospirales bacterium]